MGSLKNMRRGAPEGSSAPFHRVSASLTGSTHTLAVLKLYHSWESHRKMVKMVASPASPMGTLIPKG